MLPLRVWFLHRFGLETGIEFAHLDLESVMVFFRELQECINVFVLFNCK